MEKRNSIYLNTSLGLELFRREGTSIGELPGNLDSCLIYCERFQRIRNEAGAPDQPISINDVLSAHYYISQLHEFFFDHTNVGIFSFTTSSDPKIGERNEMLLFVNTIVVGSEIYAYALNIEVSPSTDGDNIVWTSASMKPLEVGLISDREDALDRFTKRLMKVVGSRLVLIAPEKRATKPIHRSECRQSAEHSSTPPPLLRAPFSAICTRIRVPFQRAVPGWAGDAGTVSSSRRRLARPQPYVGHPSRDMSPTRSMPRRATVSTPQHFDLDFHGQTRRAPASPRGLRRNARFRRP